MIKVHCFGIVRDLLGSSSISIGGGPKSVGELRAFLSESYPALSKIKTCMIAVNQTYAEDTFLISDQDEIAIIPPVSGG